MRDFHFYNSYQNINVNFSHLFCNPQDFIIKIVKFSLYSLKQKEQKNKIIKEKKNKTTCEKRNLNIEQNELQNPKEKNKKKKEKK